MQVGELARRAQTTPRALRYYESLGLLSPERLENGYRRYAEADVTRVHHVQLLFRSGLCGSKIASVLHLIHPAEPAESVFSPELAEAVEDTRRLIAAQIDDLSTTLARLDLLIQRARSGVQP